MKFSTSQITYFVHDRGTRANLRALGKYLVLVTAVITLYAIVFHLIKLYVEGEQHSWITGFYWTLVVMTTLGFGDITFTSDIGRLFSILVLLSGVVLLLVMLPFMFLTLFYAPWLEARVRLRAPREVAEGTAGHVILAEHDAIAVGLIERLRAAEIPYVVIEPDVTRAAALMTEGVRVLAGEVDSSATYVGANAVHARMLVANKADTINSNITLTAREVAPSLAITAIVEEHDSVDVLELSGATTVLPLKERLGEHLANRVSTGHGAHIIGAYRDLRIAELAARDSMLAGQTIRDSHLRQRTGVSVVGRWERGRLKPAAPELLIQDQDVLVVAGTAPQIDALNALMPPASDAQRPVMIIGAGKVGEAATRALIRNGATVHAVDRSAGALDLLRDCGALVFPGDAADRRVLERAGISRVSSVLLTTNDDAMNIYLAVYCRRLNPSARIVSRITHERNVEAIHRAGADFVLSYATLGVESVMALLRGGGLVVLGEGVELHSVPVPLALAGRKLTDSGIGSATGMSVVAIDREGILSTGLTGDTILEDSATLIMLGSLEQRRAFRDRFEIVK